MNDLPYKLKELREALGLTQTQLGERAGIAQEFVSEIEKGRKKPSIEVLEKLCGALGCTADYLLGMTGTKRYSTVREDGPSAALSPELLREIAERHITDEELRLALKVTRAIREDSK